jgi:hypothetical protein
MIPSAVTVRSLLEYPCRDMSPYSHEDAQSKPSSMDIFRIQ